MKYLTIFAICLLIGCAAASLYGESRENIQSFAHFMRRYNKKYESTPEFEKRFHIFKQNMKKLEQLQAGSRGARYNVTKFADMTEEEFRRMPCGVDKLKDLNSRRPDFKPILATDEDLARLRENFQAPPTDFDWGTKGAVTPVKNQEQCGSCWAFSTIGNLEGVWFLAGHTLTGLSEQELVDCSTESQGCDGGWPYWALTDILASPYNGGVDTESAYPYTAEDGTCSFKTSTVGATVGSYKSWCTEDTAACTEDQMVQLLIQYGPLSACLDALPMQYYEGGIDNPSSCDPDSIDHCITITGYGEENGVKYWKIKNSWGTDWGESGYYRLIRGIGKCGINKVITIAAAKK